MVGNKDAVADFDAFDFAADFAYDACCFVTQHTRCLGNTVPFDDVAAADAARHHFKQGLLLRRCLELGISSMRTSWLL